MNVLVVADESLARDRLRRLLRRLAPAVELSEADSGEAELAAGPGQARFKTLKSYTNL